MRGIRSLAVLLAVVSLALIAGTLRDGTAAAGNSVDTFPSFGTDVLEIQLCGDVFAPPGPITPVCFQGPLTVVRGDPFPDLKTGRRTIDCEFASMELKGVVAGNSVEIIVPPDPVVPSICQIQEQDANLSDFPANVTGLMRYEVHVYDGIGATTVFNDCGVGASFAGTINAIPPIGATFTGGTARFCDPATGQEQGRLEGGVATVIGPVGGIVEVLGGSAGPDASVDSSSGSGFNYAVLAVALAAAAALAIAVGGWYARKRWLW